MIERLLKRDRAITVVALATLCVLAWLYLISGAGVGMSAWEMTTLSLFPHQNAATGAMPGTHVSGAAPAAWNTANWAIVITMWWTMMIAMMAPSATPAILLYSRVQRHAVAQGQTRDGLAPTGAFAAGYLLAWLGFSVAASGLQWALERTSAVSAMMMGSHSCWLSAGVLMTAGLYQLSPLKQACLAHCRAPASFLSRHWRPRNLGALRLGAMHGTFCIGCCWMLMALLFVGGVMNLAWIAALTTLVLIEKVLTAGEWVSRATGLLLIGWGIATFLV